MKRFTKVCLIICSVMVVVGIVLCAIGLGLGFGAQQFRVLAKEGAFHIGPGSHWIGFGWFEDAWDDAWDDLEDDLDDIGEEIGNMGSQETLASTEADWTQREESWDASLVQNLDLEFYFGTLNIEPSDTDQIEMSVNYRSIWKSYNRAIKWKMDGDTLKIRDSVDKKILRLFTHGAADAELTIRIPKNHGFNELKMDVGAAKVTIGTLLDAAKLKLCIGAGELKTSGNERIILSAGKLDLELGAGAMELTGIKADQLDLDGGTGTMKLMEVVAENADIDCGVGNVSVELNGYQKDYDYEVDCGIGQVVIGSNSYNGLGRKQEINNGAGRRIDIDCGLGRVEITFNEKSMEG